jgi:hypothetical protein
MQDVSDYSVIIRDCRRLLSSDLLNSDVKFIIRQTNEVAHSLTRDAPYHGSFRIFIRIASCISTLIINVMHLFSFCKKKKE